MEKRLDFTEGKILGPLIRFVLPVIFALFLQVMYGAVDLLVVGQFAGARDVSAVSTGAQIMMMVAGLNSALAVGVTVFLGEKIGQHDARAGGKIVGSGIFLFLMIGAALTVFMPCAAGLLARIMQAPKEAFPLTVWYLRICGLGSVVIIAYNLIGSIFRGLGDSKTPLITVMIACAFNIVGDLLLVAVFGLGAKGAAMATVMAQMVSVILSLAMIRRQKLPFTMGKGDIRFDKEIIGKIVFLGAPIALQEMLVQISFLVILAIVNSLGLIESAGVGVAEKICGFIMLVPSAFAQTMSAFAAQNRGAGKIDRAITGLHYAIAVSTAFGVTMFFITFFHGDMLAYIFVRDPAVIAASADYLKAYAIDCLQTCFMFCFVGFFNGMEHTRFVMVQGIIGAFCVRIPVSFLMSRWEPVSLFHIGLATPCSTAVQIILCLGCMWHIRKNMKKTGPESI